MKKSHGFTLVELAIVITIIGLLIGGVLKGQELLENARMTSLGAQLKGYEAALTSFRDIYKARPGDMNNATNFITGCTAANNCANGNGDNVIGGNNTEWWWDFIATAEHFQAWKHLALAGLINGIDTSVANGPPYQGGRHLPASGFGGGFLTKTTTGNQTAAMYASNGTLAFLTGSTTGAWNGTGMFTPSTAMKIDLKLDDGRAFSGDAYAVSDSFTSGCGTSANATNGYNINVSGKVCDMGFTIGK